MLGLGGIIGTGIFVLTGLAAAKYAGPGITVSFALGALACVFTALAYSELASMLPVAGSAYTYAYVSLGEPVAAVIGWILFLVCTFGASTVAAGWSGYVVGILTSVGVHLPDALTKIPSQGGLINLPAVLIVGCLMTVLIRGMEGVSKFNGALVFVKLGAIFTFLIAAVPHVDSANWAVFAPQGFTGIAAGAGFVFMAYTGFDTLATAAEECRNPNRDLPIGIIGSLLGSALLYIVVSGVMTAIVPYSTLNNAEPMAAALRAIGIGMGAKLVAVGAIAGMTTVILTQIYGQSRTLLVMARDGMLPPFFTKLHSKSSIPHYAVYVAAFVDASIGGFVPVSTLGQLTGMFTLSLFAFVSVAVMLLRKKYPNEKRTFKCPSVYWVASISTFLCLFLLSQLMAENWLAYSVVVMVGAVIYLAYGYRHSSMASSSR
jgi:APA family basic amino acid/polyamine antiporter